VRKAKGITWFELWNDVIGLGVSDEYEKLLSSGRAGLETADLIKSWIITHEIELAHRLYPEYFPRTLRTGWQGFIEEYGQYGALVTQPYKQNNLHEISARNPLSDTRIKLGQEFIIEFDCPIAGSLIALDCYKGEWYPLPVRSDGSFTPVAINQGIYGFPIQDGDLVQTVPMRQRAFSGEHGHCFIVGPHDVMAFYAMRFAAAKALSLTSLNEMAARLRQIDPKRLSVHLENIIFE
jgi:hypothetical protein